MIFLVDYDSIDKSDILKFTNIEWLKIVHKMFQFIKKVFISLLSICTIGNFGESLSSNQKGPIKCLTLFNRPFQTKATFANINSDETLFLSICCQC